MRISRAMPCMSWGLLQFFVVEEVEEEQNVSVNNKIIRCKRLPTFVVVVCFLRVNMYSTTKATKHKVPYNDTSSLPCLPTTKNQDALYSRPFVPVFQCKFADF